MEDLSSVFYIFYILGLGLRAPRRIKFEEASRLFYIFGLRSKPKALKNVENILCFLHFEPQG